MEYYKRYRTSKTSIKQIKPLNRNVGIDFKRIPPLSNNDRNSRWYECNEVIEGFARKHGRYPSYEECAMNWPKLFIDK